MTYQFTLYVAGGTHRSTSAIENLTRVCDRYLGEDYQLDVIDVLVAPERAEHERVVATPTVIRELPMPRRRIIGDLSDTAALARALELPMDDDDEEVAR